MERDGSWSGKRVRLLAHISEDQGLRQRNASTSSLSPFLSLGPQPIDGATRLTMSLPFAGMFSSICD